VRKFLVVGNWKMNGSKPQVADLLKNLTTMLRDLSPNVESVVCPPNIYIDQVSSLVKSTNIEIGAQNVACSQITAFTGEISPVMLREFSCKYVIIGHSERRALLGETDELVARKFAVALEGGITPILCVGETQEQQLAGQSFEVVMRQLQAVIAVVGMAAFNNTVIAYEPVWAIGTGLTATPAQAQQMHQHIRSLIDAEIRIVYGGSVNSSNAAALFAEPDIDGGLIGGASLKAQDFSDICHIAMGMTKQ
jgi:triosephosphate isomerase